MCKRVAGVTGAEDLRRGESIAPWVTAYRSVFGSFDFQRLPRSSSWWSSRIEFLPIAQAALWVFVLTFGSAPLASAQTAASNPASARAAALQACPKVQDDIVDLDRLAEELKGSSAVGLLEKLRLKSAIEELIGRFKAFHRNDKRFTLAQLQEQYDLLMMRIAADLQDKDLVLHGQLCNAWEPIWTTLQDRSRFLEQFS